MISARTALFIDGGYLDNILRAFGKAKIDYEKLAIVDERRVIDYKFIDSLRR